METLNIKINAIEIDLTTRVHAALPLLTSLLGTVLIRGTVVIYDLWYRPQIGTDNRDRFHRGNAWS